MRLKAIPFSVECSIAPSSLFTSRKYESNRSISLIRFPNPFVSKTLFQTQNFKKNSRGRKIRRSFSANLDDIQHDSEKENNLKRNKKVHYAVPKKSPHERGDQDSFLNSKFDFLEPMMLGIKPEFPDWPDQGTVMWVTIEQKAKSLEIPLSLRMIKKKLKCEEGFLDCNESVYCSVRTAFASMVFIVVELQSYALKMRESLCNEDLDSISSQVQKDMQSSFVWLFQHVFSKSPVLMLDLMVLLADFSVFSTSHNIETEYKTENKPIHQYPQINSSLSLNLVSGIGEKAQIGEKLESVVEMNLWNSMVDDAFAEEVTDHEMMRYFVSPVRVDIESDGYEEYLRTDLLYQMNLSQEPNNSLLLCNYAQFLHLVAHDYDRAEECFKRAVQVLPLDAESVSQYAVFLWSVRMDFSGAEERFLQALSIEPDNSYYASRYANFLWSTGGEETCFPIDNNLHDPNS